MISLCPASVMAQEADFTEKYPLLEASVPEKKESPALEMDIEVLKKRITEEAKTELAGFQLGDTDVDLFISGFWNSTLQANYGFSHNREFNQFYAKSEDSPVLFTQEADLTLSLWIQERWFLEASFQEDGNTPNVNTYRAGYQGMGNEPVQYVGVGNTGLDFPRFPYLDLGGDNPYAFGLYGKFGGGDIKFHSLFRYDMGAREERVFVGNRERSYSYTELKNPLRYRSFVLPDNNLDEAPQVYLEDKNGDLLDNHGRHWRLALPGEYASGAAAGLVELSTSPEGMAAVAYSRNGNRQPWNFSLGSYTASGSGFLADVQDWFGPDHDLASYPQCGDSSGRRRPGDLLLSNGTMVLVLREGGAFSPFENLSRYEAPSSATANAELVTLSTGDRVPGYRVLSLDDASVAATLPFYARSEIRRSIYELIREETARDRRKPEARWPMADRYGELYLPGSWKNPVDLGIRFTNYSSAGSYAIGTDVVPGSVQVFRGGLEDSSSTFDENSGTVRLSSPAGFNEVIRIRYLKKSAGSDLGSLVAGLGAVYENSGPLSAGLGLGLRWNMQAMQLPGTTPQTFSEEGATNPGTVGLGAETSWETENMKVRVTLGAGFEQNDTSSLYRAAGMESSELTMNLPAQDSFDSEAPGYIMGGLYGELSSANQWNLIYQNYQESTALGTTIREIGWDGAREVSGKTGPFPVRDPLLTDKTDILGAEFSLGSGKTWAGFEVPLGDEGSILEEAKAIEVPFRFHSFGGDYSDFALILQIGILSEKDSAFTENPALIMERQIYPSPQSSPGNPAAFGSEARIETVQLNDEDRRKLRGAAYMRIIALKQGLSSVDGTILLAPPILHASPFRPVIVKDGAIKGARDSIGQSSVSAREWLDESLGLKYGDIIGRLHPSGDQKVLQTGWEQLAGGENPGVDGRTAGIPLSEYRVLSFFFKAPAFSNRMPARLRFLLGRGPESLGRDRETYLEGTVPLSAFVPGEWNKVEVRYAGLGQGISVEGNGVPGASFTYRPSLESRSGEIVPGKSGYTAFFIDSEGQKVPDGGFSLDEIILEDSAPAFRLNGGTAFEWKRPGTLLQMGKTIVFSDPVFNTALETGLRGDPFTAESVGSGGIISRSGGELKVLGADIKGNYGLTWQDNNLNGEGSDVYWDAGHSISRAWGPFSAAEDFGLSPEDGTMEHSAELTLSRFLRSRVNAETSLEENILDRNWEIQTSWAPPRVYIPSPTLNLDAGWKEDEEGAWIRDYGRAWAESWGKMAPDLGGGARERNIHGLGSLSLGTRPLGVSLSMEGTSDFTALSNSTISTSSGRLDFPLNLNPVNILFRGERTFSRSLAFSGADALDDGELYWNSINDSLPLWRLFPLYSLWSDDSRRAMEEGPGSALSFPQTDYSSFDDKYSIQGQFPSHYDIKAFFIPSSAGINIGRVLEKRMDTNRDTLNWGGNLGFSAVNMFGAFGVYPLVSFYEGDEYAHALELSVAQPRREDGAHFFEDDSFRIQSSFDAAFHGFTGEELALNNTATASFNGSGFSTGTSQNWLESMELSWTVPTKKSLLSVFYNFVAGAVRTQSSWLKLSELLDSEYEQFRREKAELMISRTINQNDYLTWNLILGHESIIRILGRLDFSVFAELDINQDETAKTLSFLGTIGTTLKVFF
ncbi:MAG: hypothetical protein LBK83_15900 [Treponema sp.]|jgi:hypothetical protein|nr:hypothetical protein [Treponema sp.]